MLTDHADACDSGVEYDFMTDDEVDDFTAWLRERFEPKPVSGRMLYSRYCEWCECWECDPVTEAALFDALAGLRGWSRYYNDPMIRALIEAGRHLNNRDLAASTRIRSVCQKSGKTEFKRLSEGETYKRRAVDLRAWVYTAARLGKSVLITARPLRDDEQYPPSKTLWRWPAETVDIRTIAHMQRRAA